MNTATMMAGILIPMLEEVTIPMDGLLGKKPWCGTKRSTKEGTMTKEGPGKTCTIRKGIFINTSGEQLSLA